MQTHRPHHLFTFSLRQVNEGEDFVAEMDAYGSDEDSEKEQDIVFSLSGVDKGYFTVNSIKNNKGHLGHAFLRRKGNDPQFDYEGDKQTYSIIVVATDGNGDTAQKAAIVFVGDINVSVLRIMNIE